MALTADTVGRYDCSDAYYCLSCSHDGKPDEISDLMMLERNFQENDPHLSADHSQENPISSQTHPKQIAYQHAIDSMSDKTDPKQAGIPRNAYSPMGPNTHVISPPSKQNLSAVKISHNHLSIVQPPLSDCLNRDQGTDWEEHISGPSGSNAHSELPVTGRGRGLDSVSLDLAQTQTEEGAGAKQAIIKG